MAQETTYRYGPLERGGVMLGLRVPQLVGFVVAGMIGLGFLNQANFIGLLLAVATIAVAAGHPAGADPRAHDRGVDAADDPLLRRAVLAQGALPRAARAGRPRRARARGRP